MYPPCPHSSGSRLLRQELSEASPGLHAPPRSKLLRFRHLGSSQRRRLHWACVLCPSQLWAAWVMRFLVSAVTAIYHLSHPCCSVFWVYNRRTFSGGWLSRTPRSLSKQRSLHAVWEIMALQGCNCPLPALAACHRWGMVCSRLVLFCLLFCAGAWPCLRAFHVVAIPPSCLLTQISSLCLPSGALRHDPYSKQCSLCVPAQPPLASGGRRHLHCFSAGRATFGLVICGF